MDILSGIQVIWSIIPDIDFYIKKLYLQTLFNIPYSVY